MKRTVMSLLKRGVRLFALLLVCLVLGACDLDQLEGEDLNQRKGKDMKHATDLELAEFRNKIKYTKDLRGICYAVLANTAHGYRTTLTFAEVDCGRAGL